VATVMMGATLVISQLMTTMYVAQLISVMIAINVVIRTGPTVAYRMAISFVGAALLLFLAFYLIQPAGFASGLTALGGNIFAFSARQSGRVVLAVRADHPGRPGPRDAELRALERLQLPARRRRGRDRPAPRGHLRRGDDLRAQDRPVGAIIVTTSLIGLGGFVSADKAHPGVAVVQSPEAVRTLVLVMVGGPILVMLWGLVVSWSFRLNAKTHEVLIHEVERLRAGATEAESPASKQVVEDLTGWKFERLWGRG
jgi:oligogalacturonide transporter